MGRLPAPGPDLHGDRPRAAPEDIHDTFLQKLVAKANALKVGDPAREDVAIGPLINAGQRDHAARVVEQAVQAGATLEAGGTHRELFFAPTVLGNVAADNPAFKRGNLRAGSGGGAVRR